MIKAVIFDIDGTLVDSVDLHAQAWQEAFKKYGREIEFGRVRKQIGKGGDQLMPVFFSKEELDKFGDEMEKYRGEIYKEKYLSQVEPFPKVRELLVHIKQQGKQIVLASSAVREELQHYKDLTSISDLIEGETSVDDVAKSKPHPDIFQAAFSQLKDATAEQVIVIGDTPYDAEAAAKAGLQAVGVLCGGFPEAELHDAGCIEIYRDPADILACYETTFLNS